jgi:hypothetical protein
VSDHPSGSASASDRELEREWHRHSAELPTAQLDEAIRAAARRAVRRRPVWQRYLPLAAAASVGVIAFLLVRQAPRPGTPPATEPIVAREAMVAQDASRERAAPAALAKAAAGSHATDAPLPPEIASLIIEDTARRTGSALHAITIVTSEPATWPDGSLGCRAPGELAAQVLTPGFRVEVDAGGRRFAYHTDAHRQIRLCAQPRVER